MLTLIPMCLVLLMVVSVVKFALSLVYVEIVLLMIFYYDKYSESMNDFV